MQRTIEQPADPSGAALSEFKDWLGITRPNEDALLLELLKASLEMCEAFTGQAPLEQVIEERVSPRRGTHLLASRPVRLLVTAETLASDGARSSITGDGIALEIDAVGVALADVRRDFDALCVALTLVVGIAPDWPSIPKPLRQGIIRLASHYYRDRDHEGAVQPPASVTALWRPWRIVRLT